MVYFAVYGKYLLSSGVQTILDAILKFDSRFGSVVRNLIALLFKMLISS